MRAVIPRSLMQKHPERIVLAKHGRYKEEPLLKSFSSSPEEQVDDDQSKNQADAATTVVSDARTHVVAAAAEENQQDDENDYERHGRKFSTCIASTSICGL
jgi:IMP cyclohydrolase